MKCQTCQGKRYIVRMEPETWGSSRNWCYTNREVERRYMCEVCKGTGEVPDPEPPTPAGAIRMARFQIEGHEVHAPGFTRERFLRALDRARQDGLQTRPAATPGTVAVHSGSTDAWYETSRTSCTCPATVPCKHIAWCIYLADVKSIDPAHVQTVGITATVAEGVA